MTLRSVSAAQALMLASLVFQTTVLPDTLDIHSISRVANLVIMVVFFALSLRVFLRGRMRKLPLFYFAPIALILVAYSINILRSLSVETIGYVAGLLPWLAGLSVPFLKSYSLDDSWKLFFRFMVFFSVIALIEFAALFAGQLAPSLIVTDRGEFVKGYMTLFHGLEDGTVYYKMYGVFPEPGTFAMLLLPAFAYALVYWKPWAMALFGVCLYFTNSLGGEFSLVILLALYAYRKARGGIAGPLILSALGTAAVYFLFPLFAATYAMKGDSAAVREANVSMFKQGFLTVLQQHPFGFPLSGSSFSALQDVSTGYLGSNFEPYTVFVTGGVLAFLMYCIYFIWVSSRSIRYLLGPDRDQLYTCAFLSLPPLLIFVWQRNTLLTSTLFAFLFAMPVVTMRRRSVKSLHPPVAPDAPLLRSGARLAT
ncbi:MAG: hypothetical protein H0W69_03640 [Gemmatimonadaceae bacterium]|nr:hypothetical protein [Gemmatimonadaceae bacterium]